MQRTFGLKSAISMAIVAATLIPTIPSLAKLEVGASSQAVRTAKTKSAKPLPTKGKLLKLTNGDLMCYVDLTDASGKKHHLGADFAICNKSQLLNKQVQLTYKSLRVNDCQSNEPCGKTRTEQAIVKMSLVSGKHK